MDKLHAIELTSFYLRGRNDASSDVSENTLARVMMSVVQEILENDFGVKSLMMVIEETIEIECQRVGDD